MLWFRSMMKSYRVIKCVVPCLYCLRLQGDMVIMERLHTYFITFYSFSSYSTTSSAATISYGHQEPRSNAIGTIRTEL